MSRDSAEKLGAILLTVAIAAGLMVRAGLHFPPADLLNPLGLAGLLALTAWYYRRRSVDAFVLPLTALLQITLYTACISVLMYAAGTIGRPFIDDWLVASDRICGVSVAAVKHWTDAHPAVRSVLQWSYNSLLWQTPLLIIVLGFGGERLRLEGFVRQFMLGTLACALVFALWPAQGPFVAYGYEPSPTQSVYLQHLAELRDGTRTVISWRGAEGIITFPSFHTCWAILLAWGFQGHRFLRAPGILLNLLVVASTMTTGWHYFADVLGGALTATTVIALSTVWERRTLTGFQPAIPAATWLARTPATAPGAR